jgi:dipeptide/tripeptide permease
MTPKLLGAIILGIPLLMVAWALLWRRNRPVFWFALALLVVALGYLMATGATDDIARRIAPGYSAPAPVPVKAK